MNGAAEVEQSEPVYVVVHESPPDIPPSACGIVPTGSWETCGRTGTVQMYRSIDPEVSEKISPPITFSSEQTAFNVANMSVPDAAKLLLRRCSTSRCFGGSVSPGRFGEGGGVGSFARSLKGAPEERGQREEAPKSTAAKHAAPATKKATAPPANPAAKTPERVASSASTLAKSATAAAPPGRFGAKGAGFGTKGGRGPPVAVCFFRLSGSFASSLNGAPPAFRNILAIPLLRPDRCPAVGRLCRHLRSSVV